MRLTATICDARSVSGRPPATLGGAHSDHLRRPVGLNATICDARWGSQLKTMVRPPRRTTRCSACHRIAREKAAASTSWPC
ncbi:MAG: hypothetical protein DI571_12590 [Arsenicicoccus sp.]|nr:MAG: hypothetical protein DI571_12590 [Arsenicicoccus sp.]